LPIRKLRSKFYMQRKNVDIRLKWLRNGISSISENILKCFNNIYLCIKLTFSVEIKILSYSCVLFWYGKIGRRQ